MRGFGQLLVAHSIFLDQIDGVGTLKTTLVALPGNEEAKEPRILVWVMEHAMVEQAVMRSGCAQSRYSDEYLPATRDNLRRLPR